jgi:hypothetical protein
VRVRNAGEINEPVLASGGTRTVPIGDAVPNAEGDFLFEPGRGGGRIDKVNWAGSSASPTEVLESGVSFPEPQFRWRYIQASHFGEVNTYFHLNLIAAYIDSLLRELGAPSLPRVNAAVNAHHAVTERQGVRDGLRRGDRWLPFQGGHYRRITIYRSTSRFRQTARSISAQVEICFNMELWCRRRVGLIAPTRLTMPGFSITSTGTT